MAEAVGYDVTLIPDLCEILEDSENNILNLNDTVIVACHMRAVKSLLEFRGVKAHSIFDLRSYDASNILSQLSIDCIDENKVSCVLPTYEKTLASYEVKTGCDAWYPTIDKERCTECGKCFDFCPFGVYEIVDDRVRVVHPHNCKNNCPACARTCPSSAIIFPKYDHSPINGGDDIQENAIQLDTRAVFNNKLKERLAARKAKVNSINETKL